MKRIIIFLVVIIMLAITCVCAEIDGIYWDFCNKDDYAQWSVNGGEYGIEGGLYRVYSRSTDVQMVNPMAEYDFSASEYPYFAVCYKANTTFTAAAIFFTNESYPAFSGDAVIKFGIRPSGKWETLITDCREAEKIADTWKGTITSVRYDPINMSDDKSDIFISRMGFFPDEKTAQAFLEGAVTKGDYSEETSIIGDMQCVRIPGGVLEDGYNSNDYLCTFTDISDYRKSVVMRKDNDGGKTPVALSDVNSMGYVNMLTDKKGVYTVEENAKAFSDTAHHWAAEYIDYTSAHGLFGGTSETEFSPDMPVTRGMLVTVLGRLLGIDTSLYTKMPYTDVNPDEYYAPYISWTEAEGISDADGMLFRPEEAAKRCEMAYYVDKALSGYDIKKGKSVIFNDLDDVAEKYVSAIENVSTYGIINGKSEGVFDPSGMLTRGEAATVMTRVIKSILRINPVTPYSADYFTRDRIKIGTKGSFGAQNMDDYCLELFAECGFDWVVAKPDISYGSHRERLLDFCDMNGIEVYMGDNAKMAPETVTAAYSYHPSYTGNYIYDEPGTDEMPEIASLANNFLEKTGKDPHVNLLPMYANAAQLKYGAGAAAIEYYDPNPSLYYDYAKTWGELAKADFMCVDIYPLNKTGSYRDYVESINVFARAAKDTDKEWYCYLQAYGWTSSKRNPTLRDFRWQIYSLLSFGCKGLIFWAFAPETQYYALVNDRGEPTEIYYAAKTAIGEVKKLSPVYCEYVNIGAFNINCTDSTPYLRMTNPAEFPIISEFDCKKPVLVGCFEKKDADGYAFTLVNMTEPLNNTDITVRFKLDSDYTVVAYIKGEPQALTPDSDGFFTVPLETGEGAFVTVE